MNEKFPGDILKGYIREKGVKNIQLVNFLEINESSFYRKNKGNIEFTYSELRKIKNFLNLSNTEFLNLF